MDFSRLLTETGTVLWWTLVGVVAFSGGSWIFHKLDRIDYHAEIQKGNTAAAIKLGAFLIGLGAIIAMVIR